MERALRVLQAADLELHRSLDSAGGLPAELREIFNQARERAALRVFNTAIEQQVDLLLLAGSLADFSAEPRLACLLADQFRRLQAAGVQIVWATRNQNELPEWSWGADVTILHPQQPITVLSRQAGLRFDLGWDLPSHLAGRFARSSASISLLSESGGISADYSFAGQKPVRRPCLPTQLHGSRDHRDCGMWLIEAHPHRPVAAMLLPTTTINWFTEQVEVQLQTTRETMLQFMQARTVELRRTCPSELSLIEWRITGQGPLWDELNLDPSGRDLLVDLRLREGAERRAWSWSVDLDPSMTQIRRWHRSATIAPGLAELEELRQADLLARGNSRFPPGYDLPHSLGDGSHFQDLRVRLAQALRLPVVDQIFEFRHDEHSSGEMSES